MPSVEQKLDDVKVGGHVVRVEELDTAAQYVANVQLDEATDRRLRWKADLYILSIMCILYAFQLMDKISNGVAAIMGMRTELNMVGNMYQWVGSSYYLGQLIFEFPVCYGLQKLPLVKFTGSFIIAWGVVLAASAASPNYASYITTRVLLGALESAITPAFMILTSQWYKQSEQYTRTCIWLGFNGIGQILSDAVAYGLFIREDSLALSSWRYLFIILGVLTVVAGIVFVFHVPENPSEAWFFTEEERVLYVERIRANHQGYGTPKFKWYQIRDALTDPVTYLLFAAILLCLIPNGGITNFTTIMITGMGYSSADSILMDLPSGGTRLGGVALTVLISYFAIFRFRMGWAIFTSAVSVMATALLAWGPNNGAKLSGIWIWNWSGAILYVALISLVSSNTAGHTKKVFTSGLVTVAFCLGNIIGPQTFKTSEDPLYPTAKATMVACFSAETALLCVMTLWYYICNKRRDKRGEKLPPMTNPEFADLTDRENPEFRYAL